MTLARLASIHRYPVKGFAGETLSSVTLRRGAGLPFDRAFALANGERRVGLAGA